MAVKKIGRQTIKFSSPPSILTTASIVGPKEGQGPLADYYDEVLEDDLFGEDSWEMAESKLLKEAVTIAISKGKLKIPDIDFMIGGDLLNQLISTTFAARDLELPLYGLYGACSTFTEAISIGAVLLDGGFADKVIATTSSHFSTAERQFRYPLELGNQRSLTSQWTVTGSGAALLTSSGNGPVVTYSTIGKVVDLGITDVNNMGAAMAPAAANTIATHLTDTGRGPEDYDLIITGDLGKYGRDIAVELMKKEGFRIVKNFTDCGIEIFDDKKQDTHAGGSGCGCSAVVFCGFLYRQLILKKIKKLLLVSTGALFSPTSFQQGESIPGIAHAIAVEMKGN
ncbi:stage V sporulation protein AD [Alkaliphilus pronyensis]|uniref:Stage V sporulation protein AD n=1 Tax=Alkaliphilus pronyensis TaxID=1482732 RepID=A0A6I0EX26_9FIRM|nr:stage V sporulation protein AD [Alkaliphilus pronyensis]KAB3532790.1 stage V sporulation protein AD [Alkaliphilus pronyensis]